MPHCRTGRTTAWTFTLLNTTVINAFAVPGGYIYVTRALMSLCADEAELAAVIGHEIGHVIHRHAAQRYDRQVGAQIGGVAAEILGQVFLGVRGAGQIASLAGQFWLAAYSREQEFEADTYGVRLLRAGGLHHGSDGLVPRPDERLGPARRRGDGAAAGRGPVLLALHPPAHHRPGAGGDRPGRRRCAAARSGARSMSAGSTA
ncbi:MAG: M48 family metalloprotease [Acetobacteraceae bacterium]|nr:M48 family metalloprotease [Acetobacteraceae bacterium]